MAEYTGGYSLVIAFIIAVMVTGFLLNVTIAKLTGVEPAKVALHWRASYGTEIAWALIGALIGLTVGGISSNGLKGDFWPVVMLAMMFAIGFFYSGPRDYEKHWNHISYPGWTREHPTKSEDVTSDLSIDDEAKDPSFSHEEIDELEPFFTPEEIEQFRRDADDSDKYRMGS